MDDSIKCPCGCGKHIAMYEFINIRRGKIFHATQNDFHLVKQYEPPEIKNPSRKADGTFKRR